jgi:hypothetical protein
MEKNLAIICALTFCIHLIGTLAYAARIAGVRTGHIATALTLFNPKCVIGAREKREKARKQKVSGNARVHPVGESPLFRKCMISRLSRAIHRRF